MQNFKFKMPSNFFCDILCVIVSIMEKIAKKKKKKLFSEKILITFSNHYMSTAHMLLQLKPKGGFSAFYSEKNSISSNFLTKSQIQYLFRNKWFSAYLK